MVLPILRAFIVLSLAGTALKTESKPTPTPTPTAIPPVVSYLNEELIDVFRIDNAFDCGGSTHDCMWNESDAMVLTRIAIGETPNSINDRIFVMWNIKMRSALGFKEAGYFVGSYRELPDRWGPETSVKTEALCNGGCQYSPARISQNIYFACQLDKAHPLRSMLCPTDDYLPEFLLTYQIALQILDMHITEMPEELRGYDGFRSPTISWNGRIDWIGGLASRQFFSGGEVWRDEYDKDNIFWDNVQAEITPTPTPIQTPTATSTPTTTPTPSLVITLDFEEPQARIESTKESDMLQEPWTTLLFLLIVPLLIQGFKMWREKAGGDPPAIAIQGILFGVSFVFIFFNEGVLGWALPVLGDNLVGFVAEWAKMITSLFALTMALYEVVYKAVMEKIKFATKAALMAVLLLFR